MYGTGTLYFPEMTGNFPAIAHMLDPEPANGWIVMTQCPSVFRFAMGKTSGIEIQVDAKISCPIEPFVKMFFPDFVSFHRFILKMHFAN